MNRLPSAKRAAILAMLLDGTSMRSVARLTGVSINTVTKLLNDGGAAAGIHLHEHVREIPDHRRIECTQTWAFRYPIPGQPHTASQDAAHAWTFAAIDADSRLIVSCRVGDNSRTTTAAFIEDVRRRFKRTPELLTNRLGRKRGSGGNGETKDGRAEVPSNTDSGSGPMPSTPEMRQLEKHVAVINLYALHYNYCRVHPGMSVTPAMAAGLDDNARDLAWIVQLIDARAAKPNRPKTYKRRLAH